MTAPEILHMTYQQYRTARRLVREAVCPAQAQHSLLLHLCRRTGETEQTHMGQEKPGWSVEKVPAENAVISGLSRPPSKGA